MKLSSAFTFGLLALPAVSAFTPTTAGRSRSALSMSDNAARAAAIRAAEARNQAEIEALKAQIAQIEDLFNRSPSYSTPFPPSTPPSINGAVSGMDQNQLQQKLSELKNKLAELTSKSGITGALGTAAVAGSVGALVTNALDSNRRDSINGIIAGAAGSIASTFTGPSPAPVAAPAPAPVAAPLDPRAQVGRKVISFHDVNHNASQLLYFSTVCRWQSTTGIPRSPN